MVSASILSLKYPKISGLVPTPLSKCCNTLTHAHALPYNAEFQKSAGVFAVGEVLNNFADNQNVAYTAPFQSALDGLLNYPLWFALRSVFADQQSMSVLQSVNRESAEAYKVIYLDHLSVYISLSNVLY